MSNTTLIKLYWGIVCNNVTKKLLERVNTYTTFHDDCEISVYQNSKWSFFFLKNKMSCDIVNIFLIFEFMLMSIRFRDSKIIHETLFLNKLWMSLQDISGGYLLKTIIVPNIIRYSKFTLENQVKWKTLIIYKFTNSFYAQYKIVL